MVLQNHGGGGITKPRVRAWSGSIEPCGCRCRKTMGGGVANDSKNHACAGVRKPRVRGVGEAF